ncbi:hypothetical protein BYT27DRAFT_7256753 [Phlegmacium glaucopus]|nr:hypothetical protein BYT27DRAFT_7256753 [Phlegmacium glaucopus]
MCINAGDRVQVASFGAPLNSIVSPISILDNLTTTSVAPVGAPLAQIDAPLAQTNALVAQIEAPAAAAQINAPTTVAQVDAPTAVAPVNIPNTAAPVDAPTIIGLGTGKKAGIMRPNPHSTTTRNLCALDWKEHNPYGSTTNFKHYYDHLSMEQKKYWKDCETSMRAGTAHIRALPSP